VRQQNELRRLRNGPERGERPEGIGPDRFVARCPGNADAVLRKAREVMEAALQSSMDNWPSDSEWPALLPAWFVAACAPEMSEVESEAYTAAWRRLSDEEKAAAAATASWSVLNWVFWLHPDERGWWWWDASISSENELVVLIDVDGWPYPWGNLSWLLRASGAQEVTPPV
jgi:hypothetical protein